MKQQIMIWLVPRLITLIVRFLSLSVHWQLVGWHYDPANDDRHIFAFWHARLLMMGIGLKGCQGYTLISEHRDGGFIADTLHLMGFRTIRGSSTRNGARALLQMIRKSREEHCDFGITPDGPKGPREKVQIGTIQLAKKTGLPIRSVCYATKRHWRANSWDRFYIPKPFTKGVFIISDAFYAESDDDQLNLERLQTLMDQTQQRADTYFDSVS